MSYVGDHDVEAPCGEVVVFHVAGHDYVGSCLYRLWDQTRAGTSAEGYTFDHNLRTLGRVSQGLHVEFILEAAQEFELGSRGDVADYSEAFAAAGVAGFKHADVGKAPQMLSTTPSITYPSTTVVSEAAIIPSIRHRKPSSNL